MMFGGMGLLWIVIFVGLALLLKGAIFKKEKEGVNIQRDASEILKKRYARGEIGRKEYEQIKKDLL